MLLSMGPEREIDSDWRDTAQTCVLLRYSVLWVALLSLLFAFTAQAQATSLQAIEGRLIASDWDYSAGKPLNLEGEWEVVWGKLVAPEDFDSEYKGATVKIPSRWNDLDNPEMEGAYGTATFRLKLDLPDYGETLSYHLVSPHSAWRLYSNGLLLGGNGKVSEDAAEHESHYTSRVFPAPPGKSDLILQVSNYSHAYGGVGHPPALWDGQALLQKLGLLSLYYSLVLGILFTIGMFHLIFYLADKKHREHGPVHLWFSLLCFIMVFRISGVIPYFHIYFPSSAYWSDLRFPYATLFAAPAVYMLFFRAAFTSYFPSKLTRAIISINLLFLLLMLFTPEKFYTHLRDFSIVMNVFVIAYSMVFTFQAMTEKQPGAAIVLLSNAFFLATAVNDAIIYTDNASGFDLTPFGILVLGLGYSYALLLRLQHTFQTARQTSNALELLNVDLEKQVRERTRAFKSAAAKAENSAHDRAQFIAAASHDLRQPLHALAMFNTALKNKVKDAKLRKLIGKQESSISNMGNLLQDTLDTARAEISQKDPVWANFELELLLTEITTRFEMQAKTQNISLACYAAAGPIVTDSALLQRVLSNLIDNALKAARNEVSLSCEKKRNEWIIKVADDGSGIPRDEVERIFESYVSLRERDEHDLGGYGLGLHVVKNFIKLLGGTVDVQSTSDTGTVFILTLPQAPVGHSQITSSQILKEDVRPEAGMKLLAIDDEVDVREAMAAMLESWDCKVETAESGEQAAAIIEKGFTPDLLVVDYHLYGENGLDVIDTLRPMVNDKLNVVILTGATETNILEDIEARDFPLLSKPIKPSAFAKLLREYQTSAALIAKAAKDAGE